MAWTAPLTFTLNAALTAAQLNQQLRDNLNETMPAKATTPNSYFVVDSISPTVLAERRMTTAFLGQTESTASTTYVDLATVGPFTTVTTGARAIVFIAARMFNGTANALVCMSYAVSGASTIAASDTGAAMVDGLATANRWSLGVPDMTSSLTPGVNTFTNKYRAGGGGTAYYLMRRIIVWPF